MTWAGGLSAVVVLFFTLMPVGAQIRYWGEPVEHGRVLRADLAGHSHQGSRSCEEIAVTIVVADPRPGLPP